MPKKVLIKNKETGDIEYPITKVECVDGAVSNTSFDELVRRVDEVTEKPDNTYDDSEIKGEISNLVKEIGEKSTVEVCDNQYEFDKIKTKDNNTIYLIKGDQDTWAAKDYVDELWDNYDYLLKRVKYLESLNGISNDLNEVNEDELS